MLRTVILIVALMPLVSCDIVRLQPEGRPVMEVWGDGTARLEISSDPPLLLADKQVPILTPPEVFAVFVPSHVDRAREVMIGEHWVFFKLKEGDWFIERGAEPEPAADGAASPETLSTLRSVQGMERAIVPWKETAK